MDGLLSNSRQASWFRGKSTEVESGAWTRGPHLSGHYFCNQGQATNLSGLSFLCEGDASWRHASGADAYIPACVYARLLQSCPTLCDLMDRSPPGSSVWDSPLSGILQARILEWVSVPSSKGSSQTQGSNQHLLHGRQILYPSSTREAPSPYLREDKELSTWYLSKDTTN